MKIAIIGLGNPGSKYKDSRHNLGFRIIDQLTKADELSPVNSQVKLNKQNNLKAKVGETHYKQVEVILVKPTTFVNNSGQAVKKIKDKYNLKNQHIWLITDDINLPIGTIRAREKGSSGGHNGLKSVIEKLGNDDFGRIRFGIKKVEDFNKKSEKPTSTVDQKDFVLSQFSKKEEKILDKTINKGIDHILKSLEERCLIKNTINP